MKNLFFLLASFLLGCSYTNYWFEPMNSMIRSSDNDYLVYKDNNLVMELRFPGTRTQGKLYVRNTSDKILVLSIIKADYITTNDMRLNPKEMVYCLNENNIPIKFKLENNEWINILPNKGFVLYERFNNFELKRNKELTYVLEIDYVIDTQNVSIRENIQLSQKMYRGWYKGLD